MCLCLSKHARDKLSEHKGWVRVSDEYSAERKRTRRGQREVERRLVEVWVELGDTVEINHD